MPDTTWVNLPSTILPGFPQLKISEAASAVIALPETTVVPITNIGFNKSRLRLAGSFSAQTVPPGVFYVLAPGENFESTPLEGQAAMMALMVNAYHVRNGSVVFHGQAAARAVPVQTLKVPRGLDQLPALVSFVARDMGLT